MSIHHIRNIQSLFVDALDIPLAFDRSHHLLAMVKGSRNLVDIESCKLVLPDKSNLDNKLKVDCCFSPEKIPPDIVFDLRHIH
jgi:hypothetical protein